MEQGESARKDQFEIAETDSPEVGESNEGVVQERGVLVEKDEVAGCAGTVEFVCAQDADQMEEKSARMVE
jgi:hypothetical protein